MEIFEKLSLIGENLLSKGMTQKEISAEDISKLYSLGYSFFETGNYPKAVEIFQTIATLCPFYAEAILCLGLSLYKVKDFDASKKAFETYSLLKPSCYEGPLYMAYLEIEKENLENAVLLLEHSLSLIEPLHEKKAHMELMIHRIRNL